MGPGAVVPFAIVPSAKRSSVSDLAALDPHGRYCLRVGSDELALEEGVTLIGRGADCRLVLRDPQVSRRHAQIVLGPGGLSLEDLGSANGTKLNRVEIYGRVPVSPGDRITIGKRELEVFVRSRAPLSTMPDAGPDDRLTPTAAASSFTSHVIVSGVPSANFGEDTIRRPLPSSEELPDMDSTGRLADRMFAMGRADAAERILSAPLQALLAAARAGKELSPETVDAAGRMSVRLGSEVLDGRWVNLAIELHLLAARPLRSPLRRQLLALRAKGKIGDDSLIVRYYETLRARQASQSPDERALSAEVAALVPGLEPDS